MKAERDLLGVHSDMPSSSVFAGRPVSNLMNTTVTSESHLAQMSQRFSGFYSAIEDPGLSPNGDTHGYYYSFIDYATPFGIPPVADSSAIVSGTVISATTSWTPDKTGVYSEFTVKVDAVQKDDSKGQLAPGSTIIVSRLGGSITFPSGYTRDYLVAGQGFPYVNRQYVMFLWRPTSLNQTDYSLITLYELSSGRTFQVDKGAVLSKYENSPKATLLNDIKGASDSTEGASKQ